MHLFGADGFDHVTELSLSSRGHTPYCASEICHFRLMEENISNARDVWVEETMKEALQNDCVGGKCGVLGASFVKFQLLKMQQKCTRNCIFV